MNPMSLYEIRLWARDDGHTASGLSARNGLLAGIVPRARASGGSRSGNNVTDSSNAIRIETWFEKFEGESAIGT